MPNRETAIARALEFFDTDGFRERLAGLVAIRSTSQDPAHEADVRQYLDEAIAPWLERLGFTVAIHPNPAAGFGPILTAERIESPDLPTVLTYGHGDTVRGLEDQWRAGLDPWTLTEESDLWYGRGSADNKGQHAVNLSALEAVIAERGGKLGYNIKMVLETSEERGSTGLKDFVAARAEALKADVLIASDGPRVTPDMPTVATRAFRALGRTDNRPGGGDDPCNRVHYRPTRQNTGARLAAAKRRSRDRAVGVGRLPGGRRRRIRDHRPELGRAGPDPGREDLWLE